MTSNQDFGLSPAALDEVLDCIAGKYSYRHAANLLRAQYGESLSTAKWAAIKEWVATGQK